MQPHQSFENTYIKRADSAELNRWRDAGVDPELLQPPVLPINSLKSRLSPAVAEWDKTLSARVLGASVAHDTLNLEVY